MNRKKLILDQKTLAKIEEHSKAGLTKTQIAAALGISLSTLERRENETPDVVQEAIERGRARGIYEMAGLLWKAAQDGSITAIVEYLRCLGGWTDRQQIDVTEKKLEPLIIEVSPSSDEPKPKEILLNGNGNGNRKKRF